MADVSPMAPFGILSVTANSFARAICNLLEETNSFPMGPPNEVQASARESGYAVPTIVLALAMLESAIGHAEWEEELIPMEWEGTRSVWKRLNALLPDDPHHDLKQDLEEVFVQRDVLMHGHLWKASIEEDEEAGTLRFVESPTLLPGYGDKKFLSVLDTKTLRSKRLGLNLYPPRIWRRDSWVVLATVLDTIEAAGSSLRLRLDFRIGGRRVHFADFRERALAIAASLSAP